MAVAVGREQVLGYRVRALGLDRATTALGRLDVVDLGVQDTPPGAAALALATRLGAPTPLSADEAVVWSWRGAPHVHRRAALPTVAAAAWPRSDRDAVLRLGGIGKQLQASSTPPLEAFATAVRTVADVVDAPMTKGEVSTRVTPALPEELVAYCRPCGVVHVGEMVLRSAALPAGLELVDGAPSLTLAPIPGWQVPGPDGAATTEALRRYLRLVGPATAADAAAFVGTQRVDAERVWPDGLVAVSVAGSAAWVPEEDLDALETAEPARLVRLLPPGDPWLQARDRALVVPDPARRKEVWRPLGSPGAVLVDGEVAGTWRPRRAGRRLTLTVTAAAPMAEATVAALEQEAELVAAVRGATSVLLTVAA